MNQTVSDSPLTSTILVDNNHSSSSEESDPDSDKNTVRNEDSQNLSNTETKKSSYDQQIINILNKQTKILEKGAIVQKKCLNQLKSIKKVLSQKNNQQEDVHVNVAPIIFNGIDLVKLGHNNYDASQFGLVLGRTLFTDAELSAGMMDPKRVNSRVPLSPNRTMLFKQVVEARFQRKSSIEEAVSSLNQLGTDLKRGKRKRRADE